MAIFAAGPVRHMSVRAGAVGDEMTENHGQRPYRPATSTFSSALAPVSGWPGGVSVEQPGADRAVLAPGSRIAVVIGQTAREGETLLDRLGFGLGSRNGAATAAARPCAGPRKPGKSGNLSHPPKSRP